MVAIAPVVRRGEQRRERLATLHRVTVPRQGIGRRHSAAPGRDRPATACSGARCRAHRVGAAQTQAQRTPVADGRIGVGQASLQARGIPGPATSRHVGGVEDPLEREGHRIHREFVGGSRAAPAMHVGLRQEPQVAGGQEVARRAARHRASAEA